MRRANIVSGIVLAVFGLVMIFAVIPWQIEAGPKGMMSPSLVPTMMMGLIVALSVLLVVVNVRAELLSPNASSTPPIRRAELFALAKIGAVFALAISLYLWMSPLAAGIALMVGALLALGERRPLVIILMPAVLLFAIWFLFYQVLGTAIL